MKPSRNSTVFLHRSGSIYYIKLDMQGRYTYVNQFYQQAFYGSTDPLNEKLFESSIYSQDLAAYQLAIKECLANPATNVYVDLRRIRPDGSYYWIGWEFGARLKEDAVIGVQAIGLDAAERKKSELERQKLVTEATILAQEKERAEIGRELHDNINQILTTTKMYLDIAMTDKEISEELTIKSHENISTAIEEIRILSKSLVPPSLGDIGLKEAIAEMLDNLKLSQKINIRLITSGVSKADVPGNIKLTVFRIVQEQVNNILKHSKATEAEIKLGVDKNTLNVVVNDNGVGFDTRRRMKGIGLMNIASRAEVHNGNVAINSSPGHGCTVTISIPI